MPAFDIVCACWKLQLNYADGDCLQVLDDLLVVYDLVERPQLDTEDDIDTLLPRFLLRLLSSLRRVGNETNDSVEVVLLRKCHQVWILNIPSLAQIQSMSLRSIIFEVRDLLLQSTSEMQQTHGFTFTLPALPFSKPPSTFPYLLKRPQVGPHQPFLAAYEPLPSWASTLRDNMRIKQWISPVILAGPSGAGKTTFFKALLDSVADPNLYLFYPNVSQTFSSNYGQSAQNLYRKFSEIIAMVESLPGDDKISGTIVMDEADDYLSTRNYDHGSEDAKVTNTLFDQLDNISENQLPIYVLMTTNIPEQFDPAACSRAQIETMDLPISIQRYRLIQHYLPIVEARETKGLQSAIYIASLLSAGLSARDISRALASRPQTWQKTGKSNTITFNTTNTVDYS